MCTQRLCVIRIYIVIYSDLEIILSEPTEQEIVHPI